MTRELYFLLFNLFTSVGLQNVECGQNQSEHFFFSCAENETWFFLFVCLLFSFLSFWHRAHFNYSAAACCIWTMCFVSFVLNLGSVLLSESVNHKIDKNNLRLRNVNHLQ